MQEELTSLAAKAIVNGDGVGKPLGLPFQARASAGTGLKPRAGLDELRMVGGCPRLDGDLHQVADEAAAGAW